MSVVASRYARAFADVVFSRNLNGDAALAEVASVVELVESSSELRRVWSNPSIAGDQKRHLLDAIAGRVGLSQPVRNFVAVVIDHRRVAMLGEIVKQLRAELNQRLGITEAQVMSARELGDDERRALEVQIASTTGGKVMAHYSLDARLLGGAVVRIGSTVYDGSVRGQLEKLRAQLAQG